MEKFTPIEIKWVCGLLERTSHELFCPSKRGRRNKRPRASNNALESGAVRGYFFQVSECSGEEK